MKVFLENSDKYIEKLSDKNGVCIISSEKDKLAYSLFKNRVINKELLAKSVSFTFFDEVGYEICLGLSKRFCDYDFLEASHGTQIEDKENLIVVVALINELNEEALNCFIKNNSKIPYVLLASKCIIGLSYFIAKFLTIPKKVALETSTGFFLNMVESTPSIKDNGLIKMISRKNYPFEFLTESKEYYQLGAIAAHANSRVLYIGNQKLGDKQEFQLSYVSNKLGLGSLFLDSCFGLSFSASGETLIEDLSYSNLDSIVCYKGIKDNYFVECLWYLAYRLRGLSSVEATVEVNNNISSRTTDLPLYVNVGYDNRKYELDSSAEYIQDRKEILKFKSSCELRGPFGFCKIHFGNAGDFSNLSLTNPTRINWCIDYKNNEILFFSEKKELPLELNFIDLRRKFDLVRRNFEEIAKFKKNWNKDLKNKLSLYTQQLNNLSLLLKKTQLFSDVAFKCNLKLQELTTLGDEIEELFLQEIGRENLSSGPFSESYIDMYDLRRMELDFGRCPYCNLGTIQKELVSVLSKSDSRFIEHCLSCGQIKDLATEFDSVSIINITKIGKEIEFVLASKINSKVMFVVTGAESIIESITEGINKIFITLTEDKQFAVLKCFYIHNDKLNVVYKNIN